MIASGSREAITSGLSPSIQAICLTCPLSSASKIRPTRPWFSPLPTRRHVVRSYSHSITAEESEEPDSRDDGAANERPQSTRDGRPHQERRYDFRYLSPSGRVIGRAGRRIRQQSKPLLATSLGRPAEVIVMSDVIEERDSRQQQQQPQTPPPHPSPSIDESKDTGLSDAVDSKDNTMLSIEEVESAITGKERPPDQEEVNASIEKLRPESGVVDDRDFARLARALRDGYNVRQLAQYLVQCFSSQTHSTGGARGHGKARGKREIMAGGANTLTASAWRPGRLPLDHRIGSVALHKTEVGNTKVKLIEQIIRLAWSVTVHAEEQQVGDVELALRPWHMKVLFERTTSQGQTVAESLVNSSLLLRAAEIRPYWPENYLRISARRRDAEEVARRIVSALSRSVKMVLDLGTLAPALSKKDLPLWLQRTHESLNLEDVATRTQTVILPGSQVKFASRNELTIFGLSTSDCLHARRLLLSVLDLPSPRTKRTISINQHTGLKVAKHSKAQKDSMTRLPIDTVFPALGVHRRYADRSLRRSMIAARSPEADAKASQQWTIHERIMVARRMAWFLNSHKSSVVEPTNAPDATQVRDSAGQVAKGLSAWSARICPLVWQHPDSSTQTEEGQAAFPSNRVPGLAQLLSYFALDSESDVTADRGAAEASAQGVTAAAVPKSALMAYLMPSPFTKQKTDVCATLPRIGLRFRMGTAEVFGSYGGTLPFDGRRNNIGRGPSAATIPILHRIVAEISHDSVNMPFPQQICDVVFQRRVAQVVDSRQDARQWAQVLKSNPDLGLFERNVRKSYAQGQQDSPSSSDRGDTAASSKAMIEGLPEMKLRLPVGILGQESEAQKPTDSSAEAIRDQTGNVDYLLENFERVQTLTFVPRRDLRHAASKIYSRQLVESAPATASSTSEAIETEAKEAGRRKGELDPAIAELIATWPADMALKYVERDGGAFAGRAIECELICPQARTYEVARTAIVLLNCLTKFANGTLRASTRPMAQDVRSL